MDNNAPKSDENRFQDQNDQTEGETHPQENQTPDSLHDLDEDFVPFTADPLNAGTQDETESSRIAELEAELAKMKDQALRALAEAENTRRRASKDREDAGKYAITSFARDLLSVADNFRRALESATDEMRENADAPLKALLDGIEATERAMLSSFERQGIKKITPMDEPFNPNFHEVMFEAPVPGKHKGTIIQLVEPGYVIHDRLLRPARVGVAAGDPGANAHPGTPKDQSGPGSTLDTEA